MSGQLKLMQQIISHMELVAKAENKKTGEEELDKIMESVEKSRVM